MSGFPRGVFHAHLLGSIQASEPGGSSSLGPVKGDSDPPPSSRCLVHALVRPQRLTAQEEILSYLFVKSPSLGGDGVVEKMSHGDGI